MANEPVPFKTQLAGLKPLVTTLLVKLTVPVGVRPGRVSFTVAVQTVLCPMATVAGEQANRVDVAVPALHERATPVESAATMFVRMPRVAVRIPGPDGVHDTWTAQPAEPAIPAGAVEQLSETMVKSAGLVPVIFAG